MPVVPVKLVIDHSVRALCTRAYPGHPKGCPNFDKCDRCPPKAPPIEDVLDLRWDVVAIYNVFPLGAHVARMRIKHPTWTERQLANCLYWQGTARAQLKKMIASFHTDIMMLMPGVRYTVLTTPEACGVNVTETMRGAGIVLEWPPRVFAHQVAIAGAKKP